ncbi:MAG: ABC transporter permease [Clostridia bacterium]|nr:ABC transporter permease [Clostridia bacterium]
MLKYIFRRLIQMIPVIIVISILLFCLVKAMPGDPVRAYLGVNSKVSPEIKEKLMSDLGLDQPMHIQYFMWLKRMANGDFGESIQYKRPVSEVVGDFLWNTFLLKIVVFILAFGISIPIGIICAVKQYSKTDNFWTVFSLIGISMPSFFFGLLLIFAFAVNFRLFPISGMVTPGTDYTGLEYVLDMAKHMVLPVTVLTISSLASLVRYIRNSMLEVVKQDYIRTARSKGLGEKIVIYKHAFRNALIPIVTLIGIWIPFLFTGSVITEKVFVWPGIGRVLYEGVIMRDYNLIMTLNMLFALLMLMGNLLQDIGYAIVDPRVKVE